MTPELLLQMICRIQAEDESLQASIGEIQNEIRQLEASIEECHQQSTAELQSIATLKEELRQTELEEQQARDQWTVLEYVGCGLRTEMEEIDALRETLPPLSFAPLAWLPSGTHEGGKHTTVKETVKQVHDALQRAIKLPEGEKKKEDASLSISSTAHSATIALRAHEDDSADAGAGEGAELREGNGAMGMIDSNQAVEEIQKSTASSEGLFPLLRSTLSLEEEALSPAVLASDAAADLNTPTEHRVSPALFTSSSTKRVRGEEALSDSEGVRRPRPRGITFAPSPELETIQLVSNYSSSRQGSSASTTSTELRWSSRGFTRGGDGTATAAAQPSRGRQTRVKWRSQASPDAPLTEASNTFTASLSTESARTEYGSRGSSGVSERKSSFTFGVASNGTSRGQKLKPYSGCAFLANVNALYQATSNESSNESVGAAVQADKVPPREAAEVVTGFYPVSSPSSPVGLPSSIGSANVDVSSSCRRTILKVNAVLHSPGNKKPTR